MNRTKRIIGSLSLSTSLTIAFVTLSVVSLLLSSVPQIWTNVTTQQELLVTNQQLVAREAARTVSNFTAQRLTSLYVAASLTNLADQSPEEQQTILQRLLGSESSYIRLASFNSAGLAVAETSRRSTKADSQLNSDIVNTLLKTTQQGQNYISDLFIDPLTSEPVIVLGVPVLNDIDSYVGTLAAVVNLKFMWKLVDQINVGEGSLVYVVDNKGNLVAFGDSARVLRGDNVADVHIVHEFTTNTGNHDHEQLDRYRGILGTDVTGSYVALGSPNWAVITETEYNVAYRSVRNNMALASAALIGAIVIAVIAGLLLARRLTLPIIRLMETANRFSAGERNIQAATSGPQEVVALSNAFNGMTSQLQLLVEGLEQRVQDRTAALQDALDEVERRSTEQTRLLEENQQQRQAIREASVPVLPVTKTTLVMPLVGSIDTERLENIKDRVLQSLNRTNVRYLLLDITGVPIVDTEVAQGLLAIARTTRLLGCETLLIGVRPEVAQSIVGLGLDLSNLRTAADLQAALQTNEFGLNQAMPTATLTAS